MIQSLSRALGRYKFATVFTLWKLVEKRTINEEYVGVVMVGAHSAVSKLKSFFQNSDTLEDLSYMSILIGISWVEKLKM